MKKKNEWDWLDQPQNIRKVKIGFYLLLALTVIPDFFLHKHTYFYPFEAWPGFFALFGFVACVLIILVSKLFGFFLKRKEDYYE